MLLTVVYFGILETETYLAPQVAIQNSEMEGKQSEVKEMLSGRGLKGW